MRNRLGKFLDIAQTVMGALSFAVMFFAITLQVFFRYVLGEPLVWPFELSVFCYIYLVYIGSVIATRRQSHVSFDMFYERMPENMKLVAGIVTNLFVCAIFLALIPSSISYIKMVGSVESSALGIPWGAVLVIFPLTMAVMALSLLARAVDDIRAMLGRAR